MTRRSLFRTLLGLVAAPFVAKAASASTMPQIGDPWPIETQWFVIPRDQPGKMTVTYVDIHGHESTAEYVPEWASTTFAGWRRHEQD